MSFFDFRSELLKHKIILNRHAPLNHAPETSSFALFTNRPKFQPVKRKLQFSRSSNTNATKPNFSAPSISTKDVCPVSNSSGRSPCQICKGNNHQALDCFRRMDFSFQGRHPPTNLAAMAADINAEFLNCQWLADSGANAHVTNNAENLNSKRPFAGNETIGVGNGAGLSIKYIGSSIVHSDNNRFILKNIIHCPQAAVNLLSVNKFCIDNDVTFHLTHNAYSVQDNQTGIMLLQGPSENGLYPIKLTNLSHNKRRGLTASIGIKALSSLWHQRLGHPSKSVLRHVLSNFNLPLVGSVQKNFICESCQLGKSIQQPFSSSHHKTSGPLDLVHSDV